MLCGYSASFCLRLQCSGSLNDDDLMQELPVYWFVLFLFLLHLKHSIMLFCQVSAFAVLQQNSNMFDIGFLCLFCLVSSRCSHMKKGSLFYYIQHRFRLSIDHCFVAMFIIFFLMNMFWLFVVLL